MKKNKVIWILLIILTSILVLILANSSTLTRLFESDPTTRNINAVTWDQSIDVASTSDQLLGDKQRQTILEEYFKNIKYIPNDLQSDVSNRADVVLNQDFFIELNERKLLNVRDFGAVGDGITNDSDAFQKALETIRDDKGGILYIPSGVYLVNPLLVYGNTVIYGSGKSSVIKLLPQKLNKEDHWGILGMVGTKEEPIENVHIRDLFVDGSKEKHAGTPWFFHEALTFDWGRNSSIINVHIVDTIHNGIQIDGARNILIMNNTVINADGWGIHLSDDGEGYERRTEDALVINNYVERSGFRTNRGGIDQNPVSDNSIFIGNTAKDNYLNYQIFNVARVFHGNVSLGKTKTIEVPELQNSK